MINIKPTTKNILILNCFFVFFVLTSLVAMSNIFMIFYHHKKHLWELGYIIHLAFNLLSIVLFMVTANFLEELIIKLKEQKRKKEALNYKSEPKENQ